MYIEPGAEPVRARGLLFIGDPHLASRTPGFRRDDYTAVTLEKLRWCLEYARREDLLPALLGDLFHVPRDNGNALVVRLLELLDGARPLLAVAGNHDLGENALGPGDTLSVLVAAGRVRLVSRAPVRAVLGERPALIAGTDWGAKLPERVDAATLGADAGALVVWLTHHDVRFSGYDEGRIEPYAIPGVDLVVNGHIHRPLAPAERNGTTWLNPGSISRVRRGDGSRRAPSALRVDVLPVSAGAPSPRPEGASIGGGASPAKGGEAAGEMSELAPAPPPVFRTAAVEVPHRPYDEVFHPEPAPSPGGDSPRGSAFVAEMLALAHRTSDGEGLMGFLDRCLGRYPEHVRAEVMRLGRSVVGLQAGRGDHA